MSDNVWTLSERRISARGLPYYDYTYSTPIMDGYEKRYRKCYGRAYFVVGKRGQPVMKTLGATLIDAPRGLIVALRDRREQEKKMLQERSQGYESCYQSSRQGKGMGQEAPTYKLRLPWTDK